jgi:translation initiation factor 3 subunit L
LTWDKPRILISQHQILKLIALYAMMVINLKILFLVLQCWNVYGVLNYLQALIEKSDIVQILMDEESSASFTATDGYDYQGGSNVLKVLGYFSIVGLLRVHCLLGDYSSGLKCLLPIDINQQGVFSSVVGCHITTIYYYVFANLMMRR